jgi:hypothetical protein
VPHGSKERKPDEALKTLGVADVLAKLKTQGLRWTVISVVSTVLFGIVDQFTSRIIPSIAGRIEALIDPPKFFVRFNPPVNLNDGLTISALSATAAIAVNFNKVGEGVAALAGPGAYELRLYRDHNGAQQELVGATTIERTNQTWLIDASERNWANAAALRSGGADAPSPPLRASGSSRLSGTRWSATGQDYEVLASVPDPLLRSMLANALAEVGVFEDGTEWEKRRIIGYWKSMGANLSLKDPWGGAFIGWVVKQAGAQPPDGGINFLRWADWEIRVDTAKMRAGMVAIFRLDIDSEIPESRSRLLVGVVLRQQPTCIETILGNIADRVVISCVHADLLREVRRPALAMGE